MPLMSNVMPLVEPSASMPKYAKTEIERRWRVDVAHVPQVECLPLRKIDDLYCNTPSCDFEKSKPHIAKHSTSCARSTVGAWSGQSQ